MTETPEHPTERMATERAAPERLAVNEKNYQQAGFRQSAPSDAGVLGGTVDPAEAREAFKRPPPKRPVRDSNVDVPFVYDGRPLVFEERGPQPAFAEEEPAPEPARRAPPSVPPPEPPVIEPYRGPDEDRAISARTPMDLHEMRLRLTAEPAEGRVAGPHRARALKRQPKRQVRRIPWGAIGVGGSAFLAIGAAAAVALGWIAQIEEQPPEQPASAVIGPHPPPAIPVRSAVPRSVTCGPATARP